MSTRSPKIRFRSLHAAVVVVFVACVLIEIAACTPSHHFDGDASLSTREKASMDKWRKETDRATGYSRQCQASVAQSFNDCFGDNYVESKDKLDIRFAACINKAAGADCVAAGKLPDGSFMLSRSPTAPP